MPFITDQTLKKYGKIWSVSSKAIALVNQQKAVWPLATDNYRSLRQVLSRSFEFDGFNIECQYNPGRIRSSAADTSAGAILSRPCFLCAENRPAEQEGLLWNGQFVILTNPFPIFPYHLTISSFDHTPQLINGQVATFLELSRDLYEFALFYNGPKCGASAPDHLHFQAGIREVMPIEDEIQELMTSSVEVVRESDGLKVEAIEGHLRRYLIFRSKDLKILSGQLESTIGYLGEGMKEEPMINLISYFEEGEWIVLLFPRSLQRPWQYYEEGPHKLVVSPASVELGGLIILPREEDFNKINADEIASIYRQVTIQEEDFIRLKRWFSDNP